MDDMTPVTVGDVDANIIENIEDLPLLRPTDHWYTLLVYLKVKPAAWLIVASDVWRDGDAPKRICQDSLDTITSTFDVAGVKYQISYRDTSAGIDQPDEGRTRMNQLADIYIGVDDAAVARLAEAREAKDHPEIGRALGYPESAIQAFGTDDTLGVANMDPEVRFSEAGQMISFMLSKTNWQSEMKLVEHWVDILKQYSPIIYRKQRTLSPHIRQALIAYQATIDDDK